MTVEERRASVDQFPAGLRVLAVDDDPTCLRLLETLLRRCQYHVTTTNQAVVALKLLRENKDKFDLVISDVHMPDMDGFKLLELVGLEMDLPVIMLSGNSDPKAVLQGITHGACDYLLKPVRIEELRNIWQHVVRRRRLDTKDRHGRDHLDDAEKPHHANSEGGHGPALSGSSERNGRSNRKRKDQNEEDDDEFDENGHDNEDSSSQKKPRVVWSVDLHRKFVAAVNQLGIDKAMPKRILDLMNVEKLTRENVASHLQKYRLYLKRISTVANQANMVAVLGDKDAQFLSMGSLDGLRSYHTFPGSSQLTTLASFQQGGMLGRLNSPGNQPLYGLGSAGMIQLGRAPSNVSNPVHDLGKFPQISFSTTQQRNLIPGMPISLESSQLQPQKLVIDTDSNMLNASPNLKVPVCNTNNAYLGPGNSIQILQAHPQQSDGFVNQSSGRLTTSSDHFDASSGISSNPPDMSRCNETWATASPMTGYSSNILPLGTSFGRENELSTSVGDGLSAVILSTESSRQNASANNALISQCQVKNFNPNTSIIASNDGDTFGLSDVGGACSSIQRWDHRTDQAFQQSFPYSSTNPMLDMVNNNAGFNPGAPTKMLGTATINPSNVNAPYFTQNYGPSKPVTDNLQKQKEDYVLDPTKLQGGFNASGYNTFDELMSAIVKRERDDILIDGDVNCDLFSLETCM